jgi:hypothetical protein
VAAEVGLAAETQGLAKAMLGVARARSSPVPGLPTAARSVPPHK